MMNLNYEDLHQSQDATSDQVTRVKEMNIHWDENGYFLWTKFFSAFICMFFPQGFNGYDDDEIIPFIHKRKKLQTVPVQSACFL